MQQHLNNTIAASVLPIQIADPNVCPPASVVPITMPTVPMTMTVPLTMPMNPTTFALSTSEQQQQGNTTGSDFGTTPQQSTPDNTVVSGDAQLHSGVTHQGSVDKPPSETYVSTKYLFCKL